MPTSDIIQLELGVSSSTCRIYSHLSNLHWDLGTIVGQSVFWRLTMNLLLKLRVPCLSLFYYICQQHSTLLSHASGIWETVLSCLKSHHLPTSLVHWDVCVYILTLIYLNQVCFIVAINRKHLKYSDVRILEDISRGTTIIFPSFLLSA